MIRGLLITGCMFIGVAAVLIGSAIALFGVDPVGQFFNAVVGWVYPAGPLVDLTGANPDSELRFYSIFFVAYGAILARTALNLDDFGARLPLLLGLFFLGGAARLLSYVVNGPPHALFILLMLIELILPPVLYGLWRVERRRHAAHA